MAAALSAAVGLHVLGLQFWSQSEPFSIAADRGGEIKVELVKRQADRDPANVKRAPKQQKKAIEQQRAAELLSTDKAVSQEQAAKASEQEPSLSYLPPADPSFPPGVVPEEVQRMILTHISYPKQARRHGWHGRATFALDVRAQKLAKLDLYHSSGVEVLDRAAMRGIRAVGTLPLSDGLYRLPVEFRLQ